MGRPPPHQPFGRVDRIVGLGHRLREGPAIHEAVTALTVRAERHTVEDIRMATVSDDPLRPEHRKRPCRISGIETHGELQITRMIHEVPPDNVVIVADTDRCDTIRVQENAGILDTTRTKNERASPYGRPLFGGTRNLQ